MMPNRCAAAGPSLTAMVRSALLTLRVVQHRAVLRRIEVESPERIRQQAHRHWHPSRKLRLCKMASAVPA